MFILICYAFDNSQKNRKKLYATVRFKGGDTDKTIENKSDANLIRRSHFDNLTKQSPF